MGLLLLTAHNIILAEYQISDLEARSRQSVFHSSPDRVIPKEALNRISWDIYSHWPLDPCCPFIRQQQYDRKNLTSYAPAPPALPPRQCITRLTRIRPADRHAGLVCMQSFEPRRTTPVNLRVIQNARLNCSKLLALSLDSRRISS